MTIVPEEYLDLSEEELIGRVKEIKNRYGSHLVILGHNYQRRSVYQLADFHGDSFGLARIASEQENAEFIVFCGVRFMAETAEILARPHQTVVHPAPEAGCPMADMADIEQVERAWADLGEMTDLSEIVPVTYMNSDAELKAFCGIHGGIVCTSSNAPGVFDWAFERGSKIFFFPDEHLGRNTAFAKNIPGKRQILWDPDAENGGTAPEDVEEASVILWKGNCHVHQWFTMKHVEEIRKKYPGAIIVVHPESKKEVVDVSNAAGSTGFIEKYVRNAPAGSVIAVGTEVNMVQRLNSEQTDKTVVPLSRSLCPNMFKINLKNLVFSLENLGEINVVKVDEDIKENARKSLNRMLKIGVGN